MIVLPLTYINRTKISTKIFGNALNHKFRGEIINCTAYYTLVFSLEKIKQMPHVLCCIGHSPFQKPNYNIIMVTYSTRNTRGKWYKYVINLYFERFDTIIGTTATVIRVSSVLLQRMMIKLQNVNIMNLYTFNGVF